MLDHLSSSLVMTPRRFGNSPRAELQGIGAAALLSPNANSSSPIAVRLTQKELNEPLGRSPIKGTGAARFGIVPLDTSKLTGIGRTAGKLSTRGETVSTLLHSPPPPAPPLSGRSDASSSASSPLSPGSNNHSSSSSARNNRMQLQPMTQGLAVKSSARGDANGNDREIIHAHAGGELSPRTAAQIAARATTFTALPGGPESAITHRFGQPVLSTDTAQSIISPRAGSDDTLLQSVIPSPDRIRSQRFSGRSLGMQPKLNPALLPAACLRTKEGMAALASLPSVRARDSVKDILDACGAQQREGLRQSAEKLTGRVAPERSEALGMKAVGLPTVRSELTPPDHRRLTNARNYGDEPTSGQLVNAADQASVAAMLTSKSLSRADEAVAWSNRCMWGITEKQAAEAFAAAQRETNSACISLNDLQTVVNRLY